MPSAITADQHNQLIASAVDARSSAYAPYSKYHVGAAVLSPAGGIYSGCNVENASYGLCLCAERTAIVKAVSAGVTELIAIAVATENGGTPCGACRQFIAEFSRDNAPVLVHDMEANTTSEYSLGDLLPRAFRLNSIT